MPRRASIGLSVALAVALALAACGGASGEAAKGQAPGDDPAAGDNPAAGSIPFGTRGPWPVENAVYGGAQGILETPVVGVTTDEAQNRWVATHEALYLLRPGETAFSRFDAADGLHLPGNPVRYCDDHPIGPDDPCGGAITLGEAALPGISRIVGGGPGEVFVGYFGSDDTGVRCPPKDPAKPLSEGWGDYCDPDRHSGKLDRVRLGANGALDVERFDLVAGRQGAEYWHDRTVQSLAYDHFARPHTLYAGTNHGVVLFFPDRFRPPRRDEWFDLAYIEYMGDHLHARVCAGEPCPTSGEGDQRMGDWKGLAIDENGDLWHAGRWSAGLITWDPNPVRWFERNGGAFKLAFGDPYPGAPNDEGFTNEPVFKVATEGDSVHLTGVAVCPDGRVWFSSSGPQNGTSHTIAVWKGRSFETYDAGRFGLGSSIRDVECLPDGRVVIAGATSGVVLHDPGTGTSKAVPGLPSGTILDVEVDRMIDPPALHVATSAGAAVLRVLP
jgi:hypothetical protein